MALHLTWHCILSDVNKQVHMGFLMVGHTHEDIDQCFSCLSCHLQKTDAMKMSGMFGLKLIISVV